MKTKLLTFVPALFLVILQSCTSTKSVDDVAALTTSSWELVEINGAPINKQDFAKIPTLKFDSKDNRAYGNSGCNSISGNYNIAGDKITFGPMMQTKMACQGTGEDQFMAAFNTVQKIKVADKLFLYDVKSKKVLEFAKK